MKSLWKKHLLLLNTRVFYQLEFNIGKDMWKHIYHQKIKLAIDRNIAEFNYKLMHNLLSCRKTLFKWKKEPSEKCDICAETEDIRHLIFDCRNVSYIWNMVTFVCKFMIKWKHVVIGFYFEFNQNTNLLNNCIFFIVFFHTSLNYAAVRGKKSPSHLDQ